MARNSTPTVDEPQELAEVDVDQEPDEEVVQSDQEKAGQGQADPGKAASKPKNPRWAPPEGFVTLAGFAKVATEQGLHTPRGATEPTQVASQMIYSYEKNSPKTDYFPTVYFDEQGNAVASRREDGPGETITPEQAKERNLHQAVKIEDGVAWFKRKNERVSAKALNAQSKAEKSAANKAGKPADSAAVQEAVEVEDADEGAATDVE
jgi:hypothetical protein